MLKDGWRVALFASFAIACAKPHETIAAAPTARAPEADAAAAAAPDAKAEPEPIVMQRFETPCTPMALEPDTCPPALGDMERDAIVRWLAARNVKYDDYTYEACREAAFGPEPDRVLVCTILGTIAIDKSLGIAGPVERRRDLAVIAVRGGKLVELRRLPLDFVVENAVAFSARYAVDAHAGTLELQASRQECGAAEAALPRFIGAQIAALRSNDGIPPTFRAQLVHAAQLEQTSDAQRIHAICHAAGTYRF